VLGALRHWAGRYRVDGFRFDLATTLARDRHGHFDPNAGLFAALQADPLLSRLKWIAEPWDIGAGGYQLGAFPPAGANGTTNTATPCAAGGCSGKATGAASPTALRRRAGSFTTTGGRPPPASTSSAPTTASRCATW
jgi:pullulanase/glycogen debranching enzyme